ncbi:hypothetical protein N7456_005507 [Penicillium angulare]|uniref:Zn(2)-C6 fungal-type domain-containing protein n=1 Tax=Penicillium angulare TaxID=116970 RepID=A0A9W9G069_9EURO|nr:hypothetical protein N7456_005507 [Penicillium angulare]
MHIPSNGTDQPRNKRKVKTGCKTCKARRVKCDESRPACRRCVSTGRTCDGYGVWGGGGTPYNQPQSNRALSVYCTPIPSGSMTPDEQAYFDWFMEKTTKKFAGLFASDFWETLVLQASAQEPAVRHAVVALSAAHRFDLNYEPWTIPATYGHDAEQYTLQQYNKAIHHLRKTTGASQKHSLQVALITCMVFVTLEYLRGQYQMGSAHLRYGIQLLSQISSPKPRSSMAPSLLSPAEDFAHNALIDSYSRLTIQSAMFGHIPSHMCIVTRDPQIHAIPYSFSSVLEARQSLDDLLNRVHCLKRHYYDIRASSSSQKTDKDDTLMLETQQKIQTDLSLWRKAFNISLTRLESEASRQDKFGNILLRIYHEMATVMAGVCLSDDETIFDSYTENFVAILSGFRDLWNFWVSLGFQAQEVDDILNSPEATCPSHGFTVESGFIPPVYFAGLKCRIPQIRRGAIKILRSAPHREGVWNGPLLAHVLDQVVEIEEEGIFDDKAGLHSPMIWEDLSGQQFECPSIELSSRISDAAVILPDKVGGGTSISYKKLEGGQWISYNRKVRPGWIENPEPLFIFPRRSCA